MDIKSVFSLMDKAEKSSFNSIEIEVGDIKLKLNRTAETAAEVLPKAQGAKAAAPVQPASEPEKKIEGDDCITAPISGVFYAAKAPGEQPFVTAGSKVMKGDTVCIIEAMKTMNEITAPKSGVIESVLVGDAETVSAEQPLFAYAEE